MYPVLEISTLVIATVGVTLSQTGYGWITVCLGWYLLALSIIDIRTFLLPDRLTIPLIATGFVYAIVFDHDHVLDHLIGAAAGFVCFAAITYVYRAVRRREGLGLGDAKLFSAAGCWLTWESLPSVLLIVSICALIFVFVTKRGSARLSREKIAFGPFLALGFWVVWIMKFGKFVY